MVLVEPDGTIMHLITQSNLVEFMLLNLDRLHPAPDATLAELEFWGTSPVQCCDETTPTVEAFAVMLERRITAMPLQSRSSPVSGTITVRHIKNLKTDNLDSLFTPIREFQKKFQANYIPGNHRMTLRDLLRSMVVNVFHHLFIEEEGRVSHVITLTDVINYLATEIWGELRVNSEIYEGRD
ncbi:hypothetical protein HK097_006428 [Rhizophlyctis rosea]|uniref:CBS domain-containing protein n=1 Tax=Rhizophlyctis rosea TaxID=64517 RepID=A0AAD5SLZ3_9FUNG|nr:hypothetical protein HK097_006428 [Rhizophlyctis rosea]